MIFIGVCELLGGIGLILPAVTGIKPMLTSLASAGLALVMVLAAGFHIVRSEYVFVVLNLVLAAVAAYIAYQRAFTRPVAPASVNTPCSLLQRISRPACAAARRFRNAPSRLEQVNWGGSRPLDIGQEPS